jgi:hypothetical protein
MPPPKAAAAPAEARSLPEKAAAVPTSTNSSHQRGPGAEAGAFEAVFERQPLLGALTMVVRVPEKQRNIPALAFVGLAPRRRTSLIAL